MAYDLRPGARLYTGTTQTLSNTGSMDAQDFSNLGCIQTHLRIQEDGTLDLVVREPLMSHTPRGTTGDTLKPKVLEYGPICSANYPRCLPN